MNIEMLAKFYEKLTDEESKEWFSGRLKYAVTGNRDEWWETIHSIASGFDGWDLAWLEKAGVGERKIVIFGAGSYGMHAYRILEKSKWKDVLAGFVDMDSRKWGVLMEYRYIVRKKSLNDKMIFL